MHIHTGAEKMGIGDASPSETRDETMPLLPFNEEQGILGYSIHEFNGASFSGAVFNLSTTIVGAGIMALPASIKMLGIVPGILMIVLVAFLTEASIDMLLRCSHEGEITSYGRLMGNSFGRWGRIALQASVVINNLGVMIVYMIIIGMPRIHTTHFCYDLQLYFECPKLVISCIIWSPWKLSSSFLIIHV
jgi:sodium-coupled neutral amino acid transporter 2